jgi:hypothetical protein
MMSDDIKKENQDASIQVSIENGWNSNKVKQLQRKVVELKIYQYLHRDASTYYSKLHQKLFLPQTSIMTVASGTLFISLSDKITDSGRYWVNVFVSFLTLIGSVLSVWVKFFNAEQLSTDHLNASKNYSLIIDNIEDQLSMERDEREPFLDYMNKIRKMINQQKQQSLEIDQKFWDKYFQSVSRGDLIMLNENILDEQINIELNRVNVKKHNKIVQNNKIRKNKKLRLQEGAVNETRLSIDTDITSVNLKEKEDTNIDNINNEMNEIKEMNEMREMKKNNDETDNETDEETYHDVNNTTINLDDIRRKLIYQLQRTI